MIRWEEHKKLWPFGLPKCQHKESQFVRVVQGTPERSRTVIREQCLGCGCIDTGGETIRLQDHPDAPPVNETALAAWSEARVAAGKAAQEAARKRYAIASRAQDAKTEEWFAEYESYLQSPAWKRMRAFVLRRDQGRCTAALAGCTGTATEVHHDTSSRRAYRYLRKIGDTPAFMCFSCCHACHLAISLADRAHRDEETPKPK